MSTSTELVGRDGRGSRHAESLGPEPEAIGMILLSRLNGTEMGVNADLIERVETQADTVVTLIDGTKYVVAESTREVIARIVEFRGRVIAAADEFSGHVQHRPPALQLVVEDGEG